MTKLKKKILVFFVNTKILILKEKIWGNEMSGF